MLEEGHAEHAFLFIVVPTPRRWRRWRSPPSAPAVARAGRFSAPRVAVSEDALPAGGVELPVWSSMESIRYALCSVVVLTGAMFSAAVACSGAGAPCSPADPFMASAGTPWATVPSGAADDVVDSAPSGADALVICG